MIGGNINRSETNKKLIPQDVGLSTNVLNRAVIQVYSRTVNRFQIFIIKE